MQQLSKVRTFQDWLYRPTKEETVCRNPFHEIVRQVYSGQYSTSVLELNAIDESDVRFKLAKLLKEGLILPEGDVIYLKEGTNLLPLNEAINLLAYYMHTDTKTARQASDILEQNFQSYFPISAQQVWRDGITLIYPDNTEIHVNLKYLVIVEDPPGLPEFGKHMVTESSYDPLFKYFSLINEAVGEDYFFEKTLLYPFNQRIREKSHVITGGGGNGKSLFMLMVRRLYGVKSLVDAPQPSMSGHAKQVVSYNFIGKRVVTFNDVGDPSAEFLEWLKRMITGNLEVKTPSGAWLSVPCNTNFLLETNHPPAILDLEAHRRRYVLRNFDPSFKLNQHMTETELDAVGERGRINAGDIVHYLMTAVAGNVKDWTEFTAPQRLVTPGDFVNNAKQKAGIGSDF